MVGQLDTRIKQVLAAVPSMNKKHRLTHSLTRRAQYVDEYDDLKKEESSIEAEIKDVKSKVRWLTVCGQLEPPGADRSLSCCCRSIALVG